MIARVLWRWGIGLSLLIAVNGRGGERVLSAEEIFRRATTHAEASHVQPGASGFTFNKRTVTDHLDSTGKVKRHEEKLWFVSMFPSSSSARLIEVNGHKPGPADLKQQSQNEGSVRKLLGEPTDGKKPDRERETFLTPGMLDQFEFRLITETQISGRRAYELGFYPKHSPPPVRRTIDRMLNELAGRIWIDAQEFELVRAEIQLSSPVDFLGGIAGRLSKLNYTVTRKRLAQGFWVNSSSRGEFEGRKFLEPEHVRTRSETGSFRNLAQG